MAVDETDERLPFPFKLYTMIQYASNSHYSSAVSWKQDGRSFSIHNKTIFIKQIVPRYFRLTKFRSFTRQLNNWGFTNINENEWRHMHFIRGNIEDLQLIRRIQIKESSNSKRKTPDNLRQDIEDTNGEEISLTPSTGQNLPLQAIGFCPGVDNRHSLNRRTIPPYSTATQMDSLHQDSHTNAVNQPDEDAPNPSTGPGIPLGAIALYPQIDNQHSINSTTVQSHTTTTRAGSLNLESSSIAASPPDEDDDLLCMCSILELEDSMFTGCGCSFCRAQNDD